MTMAGESQHTNEIRGVALKAANRTLSGALIIFFIIDPSVIHLSRSADSLFNTDVISSRA